MNSPGKDTLSDTSHFCILKVESEHTKVDAKNPIYMDRLDQVLKALFCHFELISFFYVDTT